MAFSKLGQTCVASKLVSSLNSQSILPAILYALPKILKPDRFSPKLMTGEAFRTDVDDLMKR